MPSKARTVAGGGEGGGESLLLDPGPEIGLPLQGTIVNRTYGIHKNLYIYLFLRAIFGPIYYGPPW